MFYLKFISTSENHSAETLIACPHYDAYTNSATGDTIVTTYKSMLVTDGVERHVTKDENRSSRFDACFVMNDNGKTIESYRAKDEKCRFGCIGPVSRVAVFDWIDHDTGVLFKKRSKYKYCQNCADQIDPASADTTMM